MENTIENKAKIFAVYYGLPVARSPLLNDKLPAGKCYPELALKPENKFYLELVPLSSITDEDAIEVGRIVHERYKSNFNLNRHKDIIHITNTDNMGIVYHVCLNYKYATLNANVKIPNDEEKIENYKHNIGEIHNSSLNPVPYIMVTDYLRSKGYALPFMGLSVEKQIEYGWIKLKSN